MMFVSESLVLPEVEEGYLSWIASWGGWYTGLTCLIVAVAAVAMISIIVISIAEGEFVGLRYGVIGFILLCLSVICLIGYSQYSKPVDEVSQMLFQEDASDLRDLQEAGLVHALLAASLKDEPKDITFSRSDDPLKILFKVDGRAVIYEKISTDSSIEKLRNGDSSTEDSKESKNDDGVPSTSEKISNLDEAKEIFDSLDDEEKTLMLLYAAEQYATD